MTHPDDAIGAYPGDPDLTDGLIDPMTDDAAEVFGTGARFLMAAAAIGFVLVVGNLFH